MTWIYILLCCLFNINYGRIVVQPTLNTEVHEVEVEKKSRDNFFNSSSGYCYIGITDLCSTDFIDNFRDYIYNLDTTNNAWAINNQIDTNNYGPVIISDGQSLLPIEVYRKSNGSSSLNKILDVFQIQFYRIHSYTDVDTFQIIFHPPVNDTNYDLQLTYSLLTFQNFGYNYVFGVTGGSGIGNNNYEYFMSNYFFVENLSSPKSFLFTLLGSDQLSYQEGYNTGYDVGYIAGENKGYTDGAEDGYDFGYDDGYSQGYDAGEIFGYQDGFSAGQDSDSTATTIFAGVLDVSMIPVNVFLLMFNYEVFGINIAGFITGLITIAMIIIIIRFVLGR